MKNVVLSLLCCCWCICLATLATLAQLLERVKAALMVNRLSCKLLSVICLWAA